jgi:hypothetical protein
LADPIFGLTRPTCSIVFTIRIQTIQSNLLTEDTTGIVAPHSNLEKNQALRDPPQRACFVFRVLADFETLLGCAWLALSTGLKQDKNQELQKLTTSQLCWKN